MTGAGLPSKPALAASVQIDLHGLKPELGQLCSPQMRGAELAVNE
jgi:hypothetical protein